MLHSRALTDCSLIPIVDDSEISYTQQMIDLDRVVSLIDHVVSSWTVYAKIIKRHSVTALSSI